VGEIYGIKSSIDGSFNRGLVEEILSENRYSVVLFDLGTRDIVSHSSLVEISEQLKQVIFYSSLCVMIRFISVEFVST